MWRRHHQYCTPMRIDNKSIPYPVCKSPVDWFDLTNSEHHNLPENAFVGCVLETGEEAFITKAIVSYQNVTGLTTRTGSNNAMIPYGCTEHRVAAYRVLTTDESTGLFWQRCSHGRTPKWAVDGGNDQGEWQYIGRTCTPLTDGMAYGGHRLTLTRMAIEGSRLGKIHPSHGCLYIPYNGREYGFTTYEVLCHMTSPGKLAEICRWKICNIFTHLKKKRNKKGRFETDKNNFHVFVGRLPIPPLLKKYLLNEDKK